MRNLTRWLVWGLVFQGGVICGLVVSRGAGGDPLMPRAAMGQVIPDPAGQQIITNEILRGIDNKLGRMQETLTSGEIKVKVTNLPAAPAKQ